MTLPIVFILDSSENLSYFIFERSVSYMKIQNKEAIIVKAISVFNRRGIKGASVSDIAKEIGIVKGSIYYHFASKEDLLNQCIEYVKNRANESARDGTEDAESYKAFIHRIVKNIFNFPRIFPEGLVFLDLYMHSDFYQKDIFSTFPLEIYGKDEYKKWSDYCVRETLPFDLINFIIGNIFTIANRFIQLNKKAVSGTLESLEEEVFRLIWNILTDCNSS